jgi:hypothetical protein
MTLSVVAVGCHVLKKSLNGLALCPSLVLKDISRIPAFLREYYDIPCNSWGISRKWNFSTKKKSLLQGACREMSASHDSLLYAR